jgi:two-component system chemotaxis response regulator CheY
MYPGSKIHILVVDDFMPMGRIYRHFLKQMGLRNVDVASNGIQALDMLEKRHYAAVVSDWHMEPITGFQLLQSVRAEKAYDDIPFIMATVEARPDRIKAAQRAGAADYILKPFNVATLRSVLANASPRWNRQCRLHRPTRLRRDGAISSRPITPPRRGPPPTSS